MAGTLGKVMNVSKNISNLSKLLTNVTSRANTNFNLLLKCKTFYPNSHSLLHTSAKRCGLMEFFDDEKNWGATKIKTGRSWTKDELRLKSNEDLHKLWYVLLKERNMLKTVEHAHNEEIRVFPNPERIDKVEDSMENLENVVRERNKAYYMLETGGHGERPSKMSNSAIGLKFFYRKCQYIIPQKLNRRWHKTHFLKYGGHNVRKFIRLYKEKMWNAKRRERNSQRNEVLNLLKRFPNMDMEALQEKFPNVDIEKAKGKKRARGHCLPQ